MDWQFEFSITAFFSYLSIAIDTAIDYTVYSDLHATYRRKSESMDQIARTGHNLAVVATNAAHAWQKCIVFSCFGLEAWFNLLGNRFFSGPDYTGFIAKPPKFKLKLLLKKVTQLPQQMNQHPHADLALLFGERDRIAHQKGVFPSSIEEYYAEVEKSRIGVWPFNALKTIADAEQFATKLDEVFSHPSMRSTLDLHGFNQWTGTDRFEVVSPLPFAGASFPSEHEYLVFTRRHLAAYPAGYLVDKENMRILSVSDSA